MKIELPEKFKDQMKLLLGGEYEDYLASLERPRPAALRINTWKWTNEEAVKVLAVPLEPVPWTSNGYYYEEKERLSRDPLYYAGLYYLQEPSAMAPAQFLPVKPGDRVLDLCAAPGGKSTELGARLQGRGLLFANDISNSRARALLKNLEMFGIPNICVSSETPRKLASVYPAFFDKILVDAPCSGEGMFRKSPDMIREWMKRGPEYYAPIQREILSAAAAMLKEGGMLLYSTCTFSPLEDEETVRWLLAEHQEMELVPLPLFEGACGGFGVDGCVRLFPHRVRGEGHFLALLRKKGGQAHEDSAERGEAARTGETPVVRTGRVSPEKAGCRGAEETTSGGRPRGRSTGAPSEAGQPRELTEFLGMTVLKWDKDRFLYQGDAVYYLPENFRPAPGIRYLRTGLAVGTLKNGRFEPAQALAMTLNADTFSNCLSLDRDDPRAVRYLKGETIALEESEPDRTGWCLVCVEGYGLGFAKGNGRSLKNKYFPGWRWM